MPEHSSKRNKLTKHSANRSDVNDHRYMGFYKIDNSWSSSVAYAIKRAMFRHSCRITQGDFMVVFWCRFFNYSYSVLGLQRVPVIVGACTFSIKT